MRASVRQKTHALDGTVDQPLCLESLRMKCTANQAKVNAEETFRSDVRSLCFSVTGDVNEPLDIFRSAFCKSHPPFLLIH